MTLGRHARMVGTFFGDELSQFLVELDDFIERHEYLVQCISPKVPLVDSGVVE